MTKQYSSDLFLKRHRNYHWNACVGPQSSETHYIFGYLEAAECLCNTTLNNELWNKRDKFMMPILYQVRHSIELLLKYLIKSVDEIKVMQSKNLVSHDLNQLFSILVNQRLGDLSLQTKVSELGDYVTSLSKMDSDGQQFRYPTTVSGEKSLKDVPIASYITVHDSIKNLKKLYDQIFQMLDRYKNEKRYGTQTSECSRTDLLEISNALPARKEWDSKTFKDCKLKIIEKYQLSNNQFSRALTQIQSNREMKLQLGIHSKPSKLSQKKLLEFIKLQTEATAETKEMQDNSLPLDHNIFWDEMTSKSVLYKKTKQLISSNDLADLSALYDVANFEIFPEEYDARVEKYELLFQDKEEFEIQIYKLFNTHCLVDDLFEALKKIGCPNFLVGTENT